MVSDGDGSVPPVNRGGRLVDAMNDNEARRSGLTGGSALRTASVANTEQVRPRIGRGMPRDGASTRVMTRMSFCCPGHISR
jgi:hypothetical protein